MDYSRLQFGQYRITERLGVGGMAVVYKAYDTRLERDVALKVIRTEAIPAEQHERLMKRFEREAKAQARFKHPHIVPVHEYGEGEGTPYLVMAYISGGTLKAHTGKPIPYEKAIRWLVPIADALAYAHSRGVIHRDIKPSNILFDEDGQPYLADFGIAKILETDEATLTGTGFGVGTPEYMAPEQWQGKASAASDQYALGVVLYELLTGVKPYTAETPLAVALKVMGDPLPQPSNLVPGIPEKVEKLLYKLLARSPQDRYEDMNALSQALKGFAEQGTPTTLSDDLSISQVPVLFTLPLKQERFSELEYLETSDAQQSNWDTEDEDATRDAYQQEPTPREATFTEEDQVIHKEINVESLIPKTNQERWDKQPEVFQKSPPQQHAPSNEKKTKSAFGIPLLLITVLFLIGLWGINAANEKKRSTEIIATATARAQKTATAKAQATATAQSAFNVFNKYAIPANLVFEKSSYSLEHLDDGKVKTFSAGVGLKKFALEVTFENPYDNSFNVWDYGIVFRHLGGNDQYRLILNSSEEWELINLMGSSDDFEYVGRDPLDLNVNKGEKNSLKFLALDELGYLFVNEQFIAELDLSGRNFSGGIIVGTGFYKHHEVKGYATKFTNLKIYEIK